MIDTPREQPMAARLSPVRCGQCNRPVTHMNKGVPGAESGSLCTNCTKDERGRVRVYTFYKVVPCTCCQHP